MNDGNAFICFEVGINNEIVDCLSYKKNKDWRCYELKVSVSDFHSKQAKTFVGNYNYYVLPSNLISQVKDEIPNWVGIIADGNKVIKRPKYQELKIDKDILYYSLFKSMYREVNKYYKIQDSKDIDVIEQLRREKNQEIKKLKEEYQNSQKNVQWLYRKFNDKCKRYDLLKEKANPDDIERIENMKFHDFE